MRFCVIVIAILLGVTLSGCTATPADNPKSGQRLADFAECKHARELPLTTPCSEGTHRVEPNAGPPAPTWVCAAEHRFGDSTFRLLREATSGMLGMEYHLESGPWKEGLAYVEEGEKIHLYRWNLTRSGTFFALPAEPEEVSGLGLMFYGARHQAGEASEITGLRGSIVWTVQNDQPWATYRLTSAAESYHFPMMRPMQVSDGTLHHAADASFRGLDFTLQILYDTTGWFSFGSTKGVC